jgi:hypothetical protein
MHNTGYYCTAIYKAVFNTTMCSELPTATFLFLPNWENGYNGYNGG